MTSNTARPGTMITWMAVLIVLLSGAIAPASFAQEGEATPEEPIGDPLYEEDEGIGEADESIPWEQRQAMEAPLEQRADALRKETNEEGINNRLGRFSRKFQKIDDDTYIATFTETTANKFRMVIDRYWLTLKRADGDRWTVVDEELRDTFDKMYRPWIAPQFTSFDGFRIEREGVTITGGKGQLFPEYYEAGLSGFFVVADGLDWTYAPPEDISIDYYDNVYRVWTDRFQKQLDFRPTVVEVACDPESCSGLLESFEGLGSVEVPKVDDDWSTPATEASARSDIRDVFEEEAKKGNKYFRDHPFRGFRPPRNPDNRYWQLQIRRGENDWFYMQYDSFEAEEILTAARLGNSFFGPLFRYYSEETRNSGIPAYDLERRPDRSAFYYHVESVNGTVELALLDPETYEADVDYVLVTKRELNQRVLPFFIATRQTGDDESDQKNPALTMNRVMYKGEELTVARTGPYSGVIALPEVIEAGATLELSVSFTAKAIEKQNHAYSRMYRGGWLPFISFGDMIDEFNLTIKVPAEYKTLGVGRKVAERTEMRDGNEINVTDWVADSPVAFPTIIFGKYFEVNSDDVYQAKHPDGSPIPVTVHVDEVSMGTLEITIASGSDLEDYADDFTSGSRGIRASQLKPIGVQAATALDYYQQISGIPYPYGELNIVADPAPALYGQAPSSLIYLGSMVFRGEGTLATQGGGTSTAKFLKSVTAHEVGHQWWGSAITNLNGRNYWFVESLAEYFSALWLEQAHGPKEYLEQVDAWRRRILEVEQFASVQRADSDWGGEFPGATRQALIYNKGPYAFHILRTTFGDEKFFPFLKNFCMRLAEIEEITTLDIQRIAEEELGGVDENGNRYNVDLGWFFDQWIRGVGVPEYSFNYDTRKNEDGKWIIEGTIRQRVVMGNNANKHVIPDRYYRGVVPLTVVAKKGREYQQRILVEGAETKFAVLVPERPVKVEFNKYGEILSHKILENRPF